MESSDKLTIAQLFLFVKSFRTTINKPIDNMSDGLSASILGPITVGEMAFVASRNKLAHVVAAKTFSPLAINNGVIIRRKMGVEKYSALAWVLANFVPGVFREYQKPANKWTSELVDAGCTFDAVHKYINIGIYNNDVIRNAIKNDIDPALLQVV